MIINGISSSNRDSLLVKKVSDLILSGVKTDKIMVLTLNSFKKDKLSSKINDILFEKGIKGIATLNISTFSGVAYNSISKNWVHVEELLSSSKGDSEVYPTLCGLDASQYFFKKIIKEEDFEDYFSKKNLMHQLIRRYKLIVENDLSE